jgi:prepilin-type N-terminal cleavage/methylation domain-containing protein
MKRRDGFSLIEMLVVIAIIAILSGALMVGFGRITKSAQRAKAQETVSNAATALGIIQQKLKAWPKVMIQHQGGDTEGMGMTKEVARIFAKHNLMGVTYKKNGGVYEPVGADRFGIVDPWAVAVLKRNKNATDTAAVPSGGTVKSHIIYYALDLNMDGFTEASVNGTQVKVRAPAIAWCAGADGVLADYRKLGRTDDVYSWRKDQEEK